MYESDNTQLTVDVTGWRATIRRWPPVPSNVWHLGFTSLLTDFSSEMVVSVLPAYLFVQLSLSPLAFGALDGLYNGVTAITRWASGIFADRWRRYKEVAAAGYTLSALCRLALLGAGRDLPALAVVIAADRLGKGIRTVPRDALISLSASSRQLGQAFGVHRALDAMGALLGPLGAFALLAVMPGAYDVVFVTSFSIAAVGVGVLLLFVRNVSAPSDTDSAADRPSFRTAVLLLWSPDFRMVVVVAAGLALVTVSDAFIYLALRDRVRFAPELFPLLFVGTAFFYLVMALPVGWFSDRFGRARTFLIGHALLLVLYVLLLRPPEHTLALIGAVALLGAYYAATDGVLAALASGILPPVQRGSGLALLTTATSASRLAASVSFGWAWTAFGKNTAVAAFALALACGIVLATLTFGGKQWSVDA